MNTERIKELQKFKEEFNDKLKESYALYEFNKTTQNKLSVNKKLMKKNFSALESLETTNFSNKQNLLPSVPIKSHASFYSKNKKKILSEVDINKESKPWSPNNFHGKYIGDYLRLCDGHYMNDWERNRIGLCDRTYAKEHTFYTGHNFICRKLVGYDLNKNPNAEVSKTEALEPLTKNGKKVISTFMNEFKNKEKLLRSNEESVFQYLHSKPPLKLNSWKFSNHIIEEFSKSPLDKVYSFKKEIPPKPRYMVEPFRRPKDIGDYFDKNI